MQTEPRTTGAIPQYTKDSGISAAPRDSRRSDDGTFDKEHSALRDVVTLHSDKTLADVPSKSEHIKDGPTASMATVTTVSTSTAHQSSPGAVPVLRTVTATTESHTGAVPPEQLATAPQIRGPVLVQTHEEVPGAPPTDTSRVVQRNRAGEAMTEKRQLHQQRIGGDGGSGWQQKMHEVTGMGRRKFNEVRAILGRKLAALRGRARQMQSEETRHINPDDINLTLPRLKQLLPWLVLPLLTLALAVWGFRHMPSLSMASRAAHEQVVPYTGLEQEKSFEGHGHDVPAHFHEPGHEFVPHHIDAHGQSVMPEGQQTPPPQQFVPPVRAHVHMPQMHQHTPQQAPPQQFDPQMPRQHNHIHRAQHVHHQHVQPQQQHAQQQAQPADNQFGSFDRSTHAAHGVGGAVHYAQDKIHEAADEIKDDLQHVQHRMHMN